MIGKLKPGRYFMWKHENQGLPSAKSNGDPFYGEQLTYSYKDFILSGLDFTFSYKGTQLSAVKITLGENYFPSAVTLSKGERILAQHLGEGGVIRQKEIVLEVDTAEQDLTLTIDANYTDIDILNIELFGMTGEPEDEIYPAPKRMIKNTGEYIDIPSDYKEVFDSTYDGYKIRVCPDEILVVYSEKLYLNMARSRIETLKKDGKIPLIEYYDKPICSFRGVHLYLPAEKDFPFFKNLVKEILMPLGYNHIILEIGGAMEFASHKEINESYLIAGEKAKAGLWPELPGGSIGSGTVVPKLKVKELVEFCRDLGIEVIPEIQSLGHVQYMTLAHPEIAEIPQKKKKRKKTDPRIADIPPDEFYADSYCPSNEKTYEILFDIMEEIIEVFQPEKYVHMGHSEVYQIGVCPVCKEKSPADLYYNDVMRIYNFLKEKNLKMMIWSDMVNLESSYKTVRAVNRLPKDIVMVDFIWYFHTDKDIERHLTRKGFEVIIGNLYSSSFPRFESRIRHDRIIGGEVSARTETNEYCLQREGKFYDIIYTAQMLWSESYREECRRSYDRVIRPMITKMRNKIQGMPQFTKSSTLFEGKSNSLTIDVNKKFDALSFTHTSEVLFPKLPFQDGRYLGDYTVEYEDGTSETVGVVNGVNVYYWGVRQNEPISDRYFRHSGYVGTWATDEVIINGKTFYKYTWLNPHSQKEIKTVTLKTTENITIFNSSHLILAKLEGQEQ